MQTDEDCIEKSDSNKIGIDNVDSGTIAKNFDVQNKEDDKNNDRKDVALEAAEVDLPPDVDCFSDVQDNNEEQSSVAIETEGTGIVFVTFRYSEDSNLVITSE